MYFLLINQFFAPDPAPTGQLLADVAKALDAAGCSVRVVCSAAAYESCEGAGHSELEHGDVRRIISRSFGRGVASRLVSYASFFAGALRYSVFGRRPDVILTLTTPPLLSLAGTLAKSVRGSRHFIWEMDLYPDVAVALGAFAPGGLPDRAVGALADFSRRRSDGIIALGPCMRERLAARGIPLAKINVAQNWVDGSRISPRPFPVAYPFTLLYSGNLGRAHDVDTLAEAMGILSDPGRFRFIFAGGGSCRAALEAVCAARNIRSAEFLPYQNQEILADHLGRCHVGLITQKVSTCGAVVPSKTYALMAAGRPFIFIGPRDATPARLLSEYQCGWHIEPGDSSALVNLLEILRATPDLVEAAGQRGRTAFLNSSDRPAGTARILEILSAAPDPPGSESCPPRQETHVGHDSHDDVPGAIIRPLARALRRALMAKLPGLRTSAKNAGGVAE